MRAMRISATVFKCHDCDAVLQARPTGLFSFGTGWQGDWFMVKDSVWRRSQRDGECRFLCVACLERRIDRKLSPDDFRRSAKVNFVGQKSTKLRRRMRGLKPAKRLVTTTFTP
jgi:hypothetical protein